MTGRVEGKVALITGAARGQGRAHAVRLAEEGASIVGFDLCEPIEGIGYSMPNDDDFEHTRKLVEEVGGDFVAINGDVRDLAALTEAVNVATSTFGRLDIVVCNAGVAKFEPLWEISEADWELLTSINLTGVWLTLKAALPEMIRHDNGGSVIITSSTGGTMGLPGAAHYVAAKHGIVGLMRVAANETAQYNIRVNTVHPTAVSTDLLQNDAMYRVFNPDMEQPTSADMEPFLMNQNLLPVAFLDPVDVANAVLFLASDEARFVTGTTLHVDAGFTQKVH